MFFFLHIPAYLLIQIVKAMSRHLDVASDEASLQAENAIA